MASNSKSTTLYSNNGYGYTLTASFNENSTDTSNNSSNITCTATLRSGNPNWSTSYNSTLTIYWHDNRENYDRQVASISFAGMGANTSKSASGTINVTHNNDGTLSGYAYASFSKGATTSAWAPNSGGVTTDWTSLTTIARYPILISGSNFNDTQNPEYNISNPDTTHTVRVKIEAGGNTSLITRDLAVGFSGKYTLELTEAERNTLRALIPNSKTLAVRETVCAMNGNTELSANYKDYTMTIVEQKPTFNATYEDTNSTTTAITQNNQQIIRNNSTLQIDVTNATAYKEATLSSITTTINGVIYNATLSSGSATFNIGTLNVSENINAVITLTDSRGFTNTQNLALTILDWEQPTAIINLQRENNYYSETNINVNAEYSSLDNKNTITIKVREKKISESTWSAYTTLQDEVTTQLTLDNNYAWDVQVLVQDAIASTTYNLTLDRGIPILYIDRVKRSLGIDCFPKNNTSLEINGQTIADIIYPVGSIYLSVNNTDPSTLFGGTWVQIEDTFLMASGSTYTAGTTGGSATHEHKIPIGFDGGAVYYYAGSDGNPAYGSTVLQNVNRKAYTLGNETGSVRIGSTNSASNIPPYLAVYVWKRTA